MVRKRRASWLRSSTLRTSVLRGVSMALSCPSDQHIAQAAFLDQGLLGLGRIDDRWRGEKVTISADHAGELPGEFRRIVSSRLYDAAQERDHLYIFKLARRQCLQ